VFETTPGERAMNEDSQRGSEQGGERKEEGISPLGRKVAGIDVGSKEHWVCAPAQEGEGREVQVFGATTPELEKMAAWLLERKVESVALESTGVYWIPVHEVLEGKGLEVLLVDGRALARVPGRTKTDRRDCQWTQRLHSCGLLQGAFRPPAQICLLRTLVRDRGNLVAEQGDWVRRMQKSLEQMNVRVHRAVAELTGATGMALVRAIVKGERDPRQLAKLRDPRCHKSEEEIAEQLTGHWREDHLFSLGQALKMYEAIQERIQDYDRAILEKLQNMEREECRGEEPPELKNKEKAKTILRRGQEPLRQALYRASGADLTAIDGIGVETVQAVTSEYGTDLSAFPKEKQFVKHVLLAPNQSTSGGKPVKKKKKHGTASSRVAAALRMAALSLRHSQTALGAYYRQIAPHKGDDVAIFATARKLATLIYRMLRWGKNYVDEGAEAYEKRYRESRLRRLTSLARELGYQLAPLPANA
jgi:transposase